MVCLHLFCFCLSNSIFVTQFVFVCHKRYSRCHRYNPFCQHCLPLFVKICLSPNFFNIACSLKICFIFVCLILCWSTNLSFIVFKQFAFACQFMFAPNFFNIVCSLCCLYKTFFVCLSDIMLVNQLVLFLFSNNLSLLVNL